MADVDVSQINGPGIATGALTGTLSLALLLTNPGVGSVGIAVTGTWTGTLVFEATVDGTTYESVVVVPVLPSGAAVTAATANGTWTVRTAGYQGVRVRGATVATGSATVTLTAALASLPYAAPTTNAQQVAIQGSRLVVGEYRCGSPLISGQASAQNIVSFHNPTGSGRTIYVKRAQCSGVATNVANAFGYHLSRTSAIPTGGTALGIVKRATSDPTPVGVVLSGPTATVAGGYVWTGSPGAVLAGGLLGTPLALNILTSPALDTILEVNDLELAPGEAILFSADANATSWSHMVTLFWQEGSG